MEEDVDRQLQVGNAAEYTTTDSFLVEVTEPSLDQIQPTGTGGYEVDCKPRMTFQPLPNLLVFVGAIVVHNQMQRDLARKLCVEPTEEFHKLLMPAPVMALADNLAL